MTILWDYAQLAQLVRGEALPLMVVDLDILDANTQRLSRIAQTHGKRLRVASKSLRVPELLKHIVKTGGEHFRGLMCFSVHEAQLLRSEGFDDLLIAYPSVQAADLEEVLDGGADGGGTAFAGPTVGWGAGPLQLVGGPAIGVAPGGCRLALARVVATIRF